MITPPNPPGPEEIGLRIVGEVKALHVTSPTDVIIIRFDGPVTAPEIEMLTNQWKAASGLENPVVAFAGGADVKVMVRH